MDFYEYKTFIESTRNDDYFLQDINVSTKDELINKVREILIECDCDEDILDAQYCDEGDVIDFMDYVEIHFKGPGRYDIAYNFEEDSKIPTVRPIEDIVDKELGVIEFYKDFPFMLNSNFYNKHEEWIKEVIKNEDYSFIYLIYKVNIHNISEESVCKYVVYSNKKMTEEEIRDYFLENNIRCEDYGRFFVNHGILDFRHIDIYNINDLDYRERESIFID